MLSTEDQGAIMDTLIGDHLRCDRLVWAAYHRGRFGSVFGVWKSLQKLNTLCKRPLRSYCHEAQAFRQELWVDRWSIMSKHTWLEKIITEVNGSLEKRKRSLTILASTCLSIWKAHCKAMKPTNHSTGSKTLWSSSHWTPYLPCLVKLNVDASWKRSPTGGSIGGFLGIVVRNLDDRTIAIRRRQI
ncbi:hypothetical protein EV1_009221 [Malus domestica]